MRLRRALLAVALLWLLAPLVAAHGQSDTTPDRMAAELLATPLPRRDPIDLAVRLRGAAPVAAPTPRPVAAPLPVGQGESFWIVDQAATRTFQVHATLALVTDHTYWFVQDGFGDRAPLEDIARSAAVFETQTYPTEHRYFGSEPQPGVDGDPHVVFLLGDVPDVAAYFSGADSYPTLANPRSNQRDMIYVNLGAIRPGGAGFDGTIAHELQHMIHFARCPSQETWVDEGAAELASRLVGFVHPSTRAFAARPDVQLNAWSLDRSELARHYQAAYLWWRYVVQRSGGSDAVPDMLSSCSRGEALFEGFLERRGADEGFDEMFADWTVANLLDDSAVADGRYGYADEDLHAAVSTQLAAGGSLGQSVPQYAASYVELPPTPGRIAFSGQPTVPLLPSLGTAGAVWWSNRGDNVDSTLTRPLDLCGLGHATARFRVWYDLEDGFDFAYLVASRDGGQTWQTVPGRFTRRDDSIGNGYGDGWTGVSGGGSTPAWVDEEADLSGYTGQEILLRFEVLTDQGYSARGFALDTFEVPELGIVEPGGEPNAWGAAGWLRVDAPLPERWLLRLVTWAPDGVHVDPLAVDARGWAQTDLADGLTRAVLVVAPAAPRTLEPGRYELSAAPPGS